MVASMRDPTEKRHPNLTARFSSSPEPLNQWRTAALPSNALVSSSTSSKTEAARTLWNEKKPAAARAGAHKAGEHRALAVEASLPPRREVEAHLTDKPHLRGQLHEEPHLLLAAAAVGQPPRVEAETYVHARYPIQKAERVPVVAWVHRSREGPDARPGRLAGQRGPVRSKVEVAVHVVEVVPGARRLFVRGHGHSFLREDLSL